MGDELGSRGWNPEEPNTVLYCTVGFVYVNSHASRQSGSACVALPLPMVFTITSLPTQPTRNNSGRASSALAFASFTANEKNVDSGGGGIMPALYSVKRETTPRTHSFAFTIPRMSWTISHA